MPIQLFGQDQIVVDYGRNDGNNRFAGTFEGRASRLRNRLTHRITRVVENIREIKILRITLVHWSLLVLWLLLLLNLTTVYRVMYAKSSLFTTICTNALLFGISDILAQSVFCYMSFKVNPVPKVIDTASRSLGHRFGVFTELNNHEVATSDDDISIFNDYGPSAFDHDRTLRSESNELSPNLADELEPDNGSHPERFDPFRWVCFMLWGSFLSFFQVPWYKFLNYFYTADPTVVQVLERVLSDQLVYSPVSLYFFFMYANYVMEGGDSLSFQKKIQKLYLGTLGCNYLIWPPVQFINFLVMPKHLQVPFSSSVGVLWNCFLSMRNASNSS